MKNKWKVLTIFLFGIFLVSFILAKAPNLADTEKFVTYNITNIGGGSDNSSWNQSYANILYRLKDNNTFVGNVSSTLDFCISGGNCLSGFSASSGDITSVYNLSKYLWINSSASGDVYINFSEVVLNQTIDLRELTNTSLQVFVAVDNGTFLKIANWNSTNTTYLRIDAWNSTNESYLKDYGDTGIGTFVFNVSTGSFEIKNDTNSNIFYINSTTGFVGINTSTPQNIFNVFGNGNFTGSVYANGNNLTFGYLYATNGTYYLATNPSSYISNSTMNKTVSCSHIVGADADFCVDSEGAGAVTGLGTIDTFPLWNGTNSINNSLLKQNGLFITTSGILNATAVRVNGTNVLTSYTETDPLAYNGTLMMVSQWNATNTSYALFTQLVNGTFTDVTNTSYVLKNVSWNDTSFVVPYINDTYDLGNSTHRFNELWVKTLNIVTAITTTQIGNAQITSALISGIAINSSHIQNSAINSSHLQAGSVNATHISNLAINNTHIQVNSINVSQIGVSGVNTTTILDNTILPIDLGSAVNDTYIRNTTGFNTTLINVTQQYITQIGGSCSTTISGSICRNTTGTFIVG